MSDDDEKEQDPHFVLRKFLRQNRRTYDNFYKLYYTLEESNDTSIYDKYFDKEFYFLSDRIDGLGRRFLSLFSIIIFVEKYYQYYEYNEKIPIIIHWIRNDSVGCNFYDLFQQKPNNIIDIVEDNNFNNLWKSPHDDYLDNYPRIYKISQEMEKYGGKKAIHIRKIYEMYSNYDEYGKIFLWKNLENICMKPYIDFHNNIIERGQQYIPNPHDTYIGIHIRTTDIRKLKLEFFKNFIKLYNLQEFKFILCSQDNNDLKFFQFEFPNTTFIKQEIQINSLFSPQANKNIRQFFNLGYYDNNTRKEISRQDMVDYYLLSKCKIIITNNYVRDNKISAFTQSLLFLHKPLVISLNNNSILNKIVPEIQSEIKTYLKN